MPERAARRQWAWWSGERGLGSWAVVELGHQCTYSPGGGGGGGGGGGEAARSFLVGGWKASGKHGAPAGFL